MAVPAGYVLRRLIAAAVLVFVASSGSLLLAHFAPGDVTSGIGGDPVVAAAERHRLGLDRPLLEQYGVWLRRSLTLDLGESFQYRRPVIGLVRQSARNTALLATASLILATLLGVPAGIFTGSRRGVLAALVRTASLGLLSMPPLVTSLLLLMVAARTGWLPVSGMGGVQHLILPSLALALPIAATLERLQSDALREALARPAIAAAAARGVPRTRLVWRHAWRLTLGPIIAIYGVIVGSLFSGSFAVELVTSWPGLGALMRDALLSRDTYLVAGCAAAGALFLAVALLAADIGHAMADPRLEADAS